MRARRKTMERINAIKILLYKQDDKCNVCFKEIKSENFTDISIINTKIYEKDNEIEIYDINLVCRYCEIEKNRQHIKKLDQGFVSISVKKYLIQKQNSTCSLCNEKMDKQIDQITIDHIIPVLMYGISSIDNVQAVHWECNNIKGSSY